MRSERDIPCGPLTEEDVPRSSQWRREEHLRVLQDAIASSAAENAAIKAQGRNRQQKRAEGEDLHE